MQDAIISVTGLGYVGLPVACAFAARYKVIGFDKNAKRIAELQSGFDITREVSNEQCQQANLSFSDQGSALRAANFHIIAVPTPIDDNRQPDLTLLKAATESVANNLSEGDIVVYESTVYPGTTREVCIPILEKVAGLECNKNFYVGYSPERINPGDKQHDFKSIVKIISASHPIAKEKIAAVYASVIDAGIHETDSLEIAEAAKIIENTQRDLNIALMNELALIFHRMDIDTLDVINAAATKWNFIPFKPGLVGGHCIGVDPYYLTYRAEQLGYHPQVILGGRRINDNMGKNIAQHIIKTILKSGGVVQGARIGLLGLTFKENCPDLRNSKVFDIINELRDYNLETLVHDPYADPELTYAEHQVEIAQLSSFKSLDALIIAVAHDEYQALSIETIKSMLKPDGYLFDIKSIIDRDSLQDTQITLWRL